MAYETLHKRLNGSIAQALQKDLTITNLHALPRIEKVVVNVGINRSRLHTKEMEAYIQESLALITGQKPVVTRSRKSISNFKIREDMIVGCMVTLRGASMEVFLDRLLSYALPRIRDFRGLSNKLDGHGNYAIGLKDHTIFPEVPPADAKQIFGLQIQLTTTTDSDDEARALLKLMGMPFRPEKKKEEVEAEQRKKEALEKKAEVEESTAEEQSAEEVKADTSESETKSEPESQPESQS